MSRSACFLSLGRRASQNSSSAKPSGLARSKRRVPSRRSTSSPASLSTLRCWEIAGPVGAEGPRRLDLIGRKADGWVALRRGPRRRNARLPRADRGRRRPRREGPQMIRRVYNLLGAIRPATGERFVGPLSTRSSSRRPARTASARSRHSRPRSHPRYGLPLEHPTRDRNCHPTQEELSRRGDGRLRDPPGPRRANAAPCGSSATAIRPDRMGMGDLSHGHRHDERTLVRVRGGRHQRSRRQSGVRSGAGDARREADVSFECQNDLRRRTRDGVLDVGEPEWESRDRLHRHRLAWGRVLERQWQHAGAVWPSVRSLCRALFVPSASPAIRATVRLRCRPRPG